MQGIDYKSLYEDLMIKLEAIEEKVIQMGENRMKDTEFLELSDMIYDAINDSRADCMDEEGIEYLNHEASKLESYLYDYDIDLKDK